MRDLTELDRFRVRSEAVFRHYGTFGGSTEGVFSVRSDKDGRELFVIASSGMGWDHVSVSKRKKTPSWAEMEQIKRLFFRDDETCFQLHVPPRNHVSLHDHCLHIWRPLDVPIPLPPVMMVGVAPAMAASP